MAVDKKKLKSLAELFKDKATLYLVGGCTRDALLGFPEEDVDICSKLLVDDVKDCLKGSEFSVIDHNLRVGTVFIKSEGFKAEYTVFRTDSYDRRDGKHTPTGVKFTDDLVSDARRRDFKCNAVYRDVLSGEYVDPLGGLDDIKHRVLSTTCDPHQVFEEDGDRILRLVRFAAELGFEIEDKTFAAAKANAWRIKDIAPERVRAELEKIFVADTHGKCKGDRHLAGLRLLDELGLLDIVLPELSELKGLEQPKKYHLYDAFEHSVKAYKISPPNLRWAALLHDIGKRRAKEINKINMHGHAEIGAKMAEERLLALKFKKDDIKRITAIIRLHMFDIKNDGGDEEYRRFIVENLEYIDDVIALRDIDAEASRGYKPSQNRLREVYETMKSEGVPMKLGDLCLNGDDLKDIGITPMRIGACFKELLFKCACDKSYNERARALEYIKAKEEL